ncbi:hypothetical protein [Halocatena marina]|uniref:Uncharacterized protein n=1 Tax=Halocatena marina TaxID=2934937 RepID=A0ABD5YUV1_9EURY|nr:hypothetical protein [Halocatena marina]
MSSHRIFAHIGVAGNLVPQASIISELDASEFDLVLVDASIGNPVMALIVVSQSEQAVRDRSCW